MMPDTRLITGEITLGDGTAEQVVAVVGPPARHAAGDDFACKVCIPRLFATEKWVFGVDAAQARDIAQEFVQLVFESHGIRPVWRSPG